MASKPIEHKGSYQAERTHPQGQGKGIVRPALPVQMGPSGLGRLRQVLDGQGRAGFVHLLPEQIVAAHAKNPAELDDIFRVRHRVVKLPLAHRLAGHREPGGQLFLGKAALLAQLL